MDAGDGFLMGAIGGLTAAAMVALCFRRFQRALPASSAPFPALSFLRASDSRTEPRKEFSSRQVNGETREESECPLPARDNHELGDLLLELANVINLTANDNVNPQEAFSWARNSLKTIDSSSPYLVEARNLLIKEIDRIREANSRLHVELDRAYQGIHDKEKLIRDLTFQARIDSLTGLPNRAAFDERLREAIAGLERNAAPFSLLMLDIDNFKRLNDAFGHVSGDHVLRGTAERISASIRVNDIAFRYGGEEFAVIIPGSRIAESLRVAERIRATVKANAFMVDGKRVGVTISGGIAECAFGMREEDIVEVADSALYQAKKRGRNRVVVAGGRTGNYLLPGRDLQPGTGPRDFPQDMPAR